MGLSEWFTWPFPNPLLPERVQSRKQSSMGIMAHKINTDLLWKLDFTQMWPPVGEVEVEGSGEELLIQPPDAHWQVSEVRV